MPEIIKAGTTAIRFFNSLVNYSRKKNFDGLIKKLELDDIELEQAKLEDPFYLATLIKTIEAIERAASKEKIDVLRNLFVAFDSEGHINNKPDFYQECLSIFSDLSMREIDFLYQLDVSGLPFIDERPRNTSDSGDYNQTESTSKSWVEARDRCCNELNIDIHMFDALITKLSRTGFISNMAVFNDTAYYFSPLYRDLKKMISMGYYLS